MIYKAPKSQKESGRIGWWFLLWFTLLPSYAENWTQKQ